MATGVIPPAMSLGMSPDEPAVTITGPGVNMSFAAGTVVSQVLSLVTGELYTLTVHKFGAVELASGLTADDVALYGNPGAGAFASGTPTTDTDLKTVPSCALSTTGGRVKNDFTFGGRLFCTYVNSGTVTVTLQQQRENLTWADRDSTGTATCGECGVASIADVGTKTWSCSADCKKLDSWRIKSVFVLSLTHAVWVAYEDDCVGSSPAAPLGLSRVLTCTLYHVV